MELTGGVESFTLSFSPSAEPDVVSGGGYEVFAVLQDQLVNGDFVPASNNRVYKGPNTVVTVPCSAGIWCVKAAAYDVFGDTGLNYTPMMAVTVKASVDDLLDKLTGQITSSQLNKALQDATSAAADLPNMYLLRVNENGHIAGIGLGVEGDTSEAEILADRFAIVNPADENTVVVPFIVVDGQVYIRKAIIKDADIDTLKIAGNAVTVTQYNHASNPGYMSNVYGAVQQLLQFQVDHRDLQYPTVFTVNATIGIPSSPASWQAGVVCQAFIVRGTESTDYQVGSAEGFRSFPIFGPSAQVGFSFQVIDQNPPAGLNTYTVFGWGNVDAPPGTGWTQDQLDTLTAGTPWDLISVSVIGAKR